MPTVNKTFDEWKAEGWQVQKGEKATGHNDKGKATFAPSQVKRAGRRLRQKHLSGDYYDMDDYQADYDRWYDEYGCTRDWA